MTPITVTTTLGGKDVTIETGRIAKQADGSALVTCGSNIVLVTAVSSRSESKMDFFPLTCEFLEKSYAAGRFPGGFFKREAKPNVDATLSARSMDRPIRPMFPEGYRRDTQVVATILSSDGTYSMDSLASIGASAALHISAIPFNGPTATVVVGRVEGELVINPSPSELEKSDLEIVVAGTRKGLLMVEGEAEFVAEADILEALKFAHKMILPLIDLQDELLKKVGAKEKREFIAFTVDSDFKKQAEEFCAPKVKEALGIRNKLERYAAVDALKVEATEKFIASIGEKDLKELRKKELGIIIGDLKYDISRSTLLDTGVRIDGRDSKKIRPIFCEVALLPRAHGSGLFTRGETQVLGTVTLGTKDDEQSIDALNGMYKKNFLLHYNFPPYCVGEAGRLGFTSRRELGHGSLAEKALRPILPSAEKWPYTIRVVGDVMESNGSSSMGTVCAGTMALLDAGVPIKSNVAGIAMGLITDNKRVAILSDILGDEDHLGDMDFKVTGTREGITALQMDIKIDSISFDIMQEAMMQAKEGRNHILDEMEKAIQQPREEISEYAPRIISIKVKPDKVREVIGAGGKVIRGIVEETGVKIDIEDDGTINIASTDPEASKAAIKMIEDIVSEAELGKTYKGKVVKIVDFGAFVEVLPGSQGLLHISEISHERIRSVDEVLKEGDEVDVKVLDVDRSGRIKLSRKALLSNEQQH